MTAEEKKLRDQERQLDHDIQVRYLRIQRIKRQMAEELDPSSEEFDRAAAQLLKLQDEQRAKGFERGEIHQRISRLNYNQ